MTNQGSGKITNKVFGTLKSGEEISLYTLENSHGVEVKITNYGGIITSISTPDKNGQFENIVLGFDSLSHYLGEHPYFGAIIGRYANRIENGQFTLDGTLYELARNNGPNHLHGGQKGFDKVVWKPEVTSDGCLQLTYTSPDGEEGYPGEMSIKVTYKLTNDNELKICYQASTDKSTPFNITNHSYFNLSGNPEKTVLNHHISIKADKYTPVNDEQIPTGELATVVSKPFDLRKPTVIGDSIDQVPGGFDHNFILNKTNDTSDSLIHAATVVDTVSGRQLDVYTTEPGVQFYSGNFLDGSLTGPNGREYIQHAGFCLETQHFPNSPNQPNFPNVILEPNETFESTTTYKFSLQK